MYWKPHSLNKVWRLKKRNKGQRGRKRSGFACTNNELSSIEQSYSAARISPDPTGSNQSENLNLLRKKNITKKTALQSKKGINASTHINGGTQTKLTKETNLTWGKKETPICFTRRRRKRGWDEKDRKVMKKETKEPNQTFGTIMFEWNKHPSPCDLI